MKLAAISIVVFVAAGCSGSSKVGDGGRLEAAPPDSAPPGDGPESRDGPKAGGDARADGPGLVDSATVDAATPPTWKKVPSPSSGKLVAVHGTSASDVWAVGDAMLHFNGTAWTVASNKAASKVWAASPTDVWAATMGSVLRKVGNDWKTVTVPGAPGSTIWTGVWGAAGHVWAAGLTNPLPPATSGLARFDGVSWTLMTVQGIAESMSGTGAVDIWAVGQESTGGAASWHYDGTGWQARAVGSKKSLHGVWAVSNTDAWAVGKQQILHLQGASWTDATPPALGKGWLVWIWGSSPSSIWAVGYSDRDTSAGTFGHGLIYHYDGAAWQPVTVPGVIDASTPALFAVWGSGPNDVWAVGASGTLLRLSP
jgi:hypothetical protein